MRIQVTGSRNWGHVLTEKPSKYKDNNYLDYAAWERVAILLLRAQEKYGDELKVCEGHAEGLDIMVYALCLQMGIEVKPMPADWENFGRSAGPIRNQQMIDEFDPELGLAFSNDIKNSRGTKDMCRRLIKADIPTFLFSITPSSYNKKRLTKEDLL